MHGTPIRLNPKSCFPIVALLILALANAPENLPAQNAPPPDASDALWSRIEAQLDQQTTDSSSQFILPLVRSHCGPDFGCLHQNYYNTMIRLERRFNLPAAIFVGEELAKVAEKHNAPEVEAQTRLDICRYQDALGNARLAAINIEKALHLFEQAGDLRKITLGKYWKLKVSFRHRKNEEVLPPMEALLSEARLHNDTGMLIRLHQNLAGLNYTARRYGEMAKHLDDLEAIVQSNPLIEHRKRYWMLIFKGRGDLANATKNFESARGFYYKALLVSQEIPDRWIEIKCLQVLAELDWELGNRVSAKSYIERAHALAEERQLDDLLISSFGIKVTFAEAEGRYAEALEFLKKMRMHEESWEIRGSGHNARQYFLEVEKENQQLELNLKKAQLRNSLIIVLLVVLLAAGLFFGYRRQRQGKRKLAEQNALIRQQSARLEDLDAAKSRFFANVAHELRTPLTLLLGPIHSLLKENHLTEKQARLLQMADRSGKQLEQLVNEILDLRKLEMGKMAMDEKPTELRAYFLTYFAQFESLAERKQIDFSFALLMTDKVVANIDREKCRQILFNLLSNAFKFTPAGGQIGTKVTLENGRLHLAVSDTGPGIHPDDLPHVFDRFFQTTRPDKPAEGGTGIGLNLCREYAHLFGGAIEVETTLGQGSVFRVAFPVALYGETPVSPRALYGETPVSPRAMYGETPVSPRIMYGETPVSPRINAAGESRVLPHTHISKPTILVVEDNLDLQDYIRSHLQEKYHVVTAENGQVALEVLGRFGYQSGVGCEQKPPRSNPSPVGRGDVEDSAVVVAPPLPTQAGAGVGLILSDLMMPVMDGYQLLEQLKSDDATRHIPVIMLTARAEAQDKLKALRIGVDDYLLKPFDEEELLVRIENLLKNQKVRQAEASSEAEPAAAAPLLSQPDREWLEIFEAYVQKHFSSDLLNVSALAHEFAMSESTLLRQLKRLTGLSPIQYLQEVRLAEARRLLENRACDSIAQVASKVGYDDARSFSRSFRQRFGKLPSEMMGE